jgi:hypothetical protein
VDEKKKLRPAVPVLNQEEETERGSQFWLEASTEQIQSFLMQLEDRGEGRDKLTRMLKDELERRKRRAVVRRHAYTAIVRVGGYVIGRADEGTPGYTPEPSFGTFTDYQKAKDRADKLNRALGLTEAEAMLIVLDTMRKGSGPRREGPDR